MIETVTAVDLTLEWFERVWNKLDETAIYDLMADCCEIKGLNLQDVGPKAFVSYFEKFTSTFEDIEIIVFEILENDDLVLGHARFTAKHRDSGINVDTVFSISAKWQDGKMIEARNVINFISLLSQLGFVDQDFFQKAIMN